MDPDELKWHLRFLELATHVSRWSKDPSTKVGAILVDDDRLVIGVGYNGFPRGVDDSPTRLSNRSLKYPRIVHAEANAIACSRRDLSDLTLYVTMPTCCECAKLVIQSGISHVVWPNTTEPIRRDWADSIGVASEMYYEAGIEVLQV